MKKYYEEPNEIPEEEIEILQDAEDEKDELCGADEDFEDSKERPNEK